MWGWWVVVKSEFFSWVYAGSSSKRLLQIIFMSASLPKMLASHPKLLQHRHYKIGQIKFLTKATHSALITKLICLWWMENLSGTSLHKATLDLVVTIVKIHTRNELFKYKKFKLFPSQIKLSLFTKTQKWFCKLDMYLGLSIIFEFRKGFGKIGLQR